MTEKAGIEQRRRCWVETDDNDRPTELLTEPAFSSDTPAELTDSEVAQFYAAKRAWKSAQELVLSRMGSQ